MALLLLLFSATRKLRSCVAQFLRSYDVSHDRTIFMMERNFRATLVTFVNFEAAWIQTLTAVSCDY